VRIMEGRQPTAWLGRVGGLLAALTIVLTAHLATPRPVFACDCMAAEPMAASPEEFAALLARDRERFGTVVREANIRAE